MGWFDYGAYVYKRQWIKGNERWQPIEPVERIELGDTPLPEELPDTENTFNAVLQTKSGLTVIMQKNSVWIYNLALNRVVFQIAWYEIYDEELMTGIAKHHKQSLRPPERSIPHTYHWNNYRIDIWGALAKKPTEEFGIIYSVVHLRTPDEGEFLACCGYGFADNAAGVADDGYIYDENGKKAFNGQYFPRSAEMLEMLEYQLAQHPSTGVQGAKKI